MYIIVLLNRYLKINRRPMSIGYNKYLFVHVACLKCIIYIGKMTLTLFTLYTI